MIKAISILQFILTVIGAQNYYYQSRNVSRKTLSGLAAYRSALTLDWIAAEDSRQRELVSNFETGAPPGRFISSDCVAYPKPAPGKVSRLMLELLRNLEGDDGVLISELIQALVRTKILVEASVFEAEPDFEALVKTPTLMMGEPHSTFPRIVAAVWMLVTDPAITKKYGWCPIKQVNKYLQRAKPRDIAKQMKALEVIVARARFVMEEFIQSITPINMSQRRPKLKNTPKRISTTNIHRIFEKRPVHRMGSQLAMIQTSSLSSEAIDTGPPHNMIDGSAVTRANKGSIMTSSISMFLFLLSFAINCF